MEPQWGKRQVSTITRREVQKWVNDLAEVLSPSSVGTVVGVLQGILDVAVEDRRTTVNIARGVQLPKREYVDHDYLTAAQVRELAEKVSDHAEIVYLLAYVGLRWGEMAALRPRDIDVARRRIFITRSASKSNNASNIGAPKTWELRSVSVPEEVMQRLIPSIEAAGGRDALIWTRPDGSPLRPPTTTHWLIKAVHRLAKAEPRDTGEVKVNSAGEMVSVFEWVSTTEFPIIGAHKLRHTAASPMIASGANPKTVQRQLGHKSAAMTLDRYGHLYDDDLDLVARRLDEIIRAQNVPKPAAVPTTQT